MHGAQIASAGYPQAAQPWRGALGRPKSAPESSGWSWAKAVNVDASSGLKTLSSDAPETKPKSAALDEESSTPDQDAARANAELSAQDEAKLRSGDARQAVALAPGKAGVQAGLTRKTAAAGPGEKQLEAETRKHKATAEEAGAKAAQPGLQVESPAALPAVPLQAASAPPAAAEAKDKLEGASGKSVVKTSAASAKHERAAVANGGNDAKASAADAKAMASGETTPAKTTVTEELKARTPDTIAPVVSSHRGPLVADVGQSIGSSAQTIVGVEAVGVAHKPATTASNLPATTSSGSTGAAGAAQPNAPQTLLAGAGQLEVGVLDGTHGWLKIRAELGADGAVNAVLTSSTTAHQAVRDTVPAMAGYLASESLKVQKIAVDRVDDAYAKSGDAATSGGGSNPRDDGADGTRQAYKPGPNSEVSSMNPSSTQGLEIGGISAAMFGSAGAMFGGNGIGHWLNVSA